MTEPSPARPFSGPPAGTAADVGDTDRFADLPRRPVSEHVAVFEAEHARLQRELATIDQV